jgi:hypothetical protein
VLTDLLLLRLCGPLWQRCSTGLSFSKVLFIKLQGACAPLLHLYPLCYSASLC